MNARETRGDVVTSYKNAQTRTVTADGVTYAYRDLGPRTGMPVIFITHLAAVLDNWDPRVVDGIAAKHRVITFDNRGVGASTGKTPKTIEEMAKDAVTFIRALGFEQVDVLSFSMGGMIAQVIAQTDPQLIRRLILAGTGPAGGEGIKNVTRLSDYDTLRALLTFQDPKQFLFFTRTPNGIRAGKQFLARLKERTQDRDKAIALTAYRSQLKAIHRWGLAQPQDLSVIKIPVLVANGDNDRMVPTPNSYDMDRRLPNSELVIYPDGGHGGIFQYHEQLGPPARVLLGGRGGGGVWGAGAVFFSFAPCPPRGATALVTCSTSLTCPLLGHAAPRRLSCGMAMRRPVWSTCRPGGRPGTCAAAMAYRMRATPSAVRAEGRRVGVASEMAIAPGHPLSLAAEARVYGTGVVALVRWSPSRC
ncbi:alpha/beta fold hydrolase [Streptomyces sp. NPDC005374]|uniref:alpha/beta fold hydrolase n=1 Tax=Streptomyces sp. NPDC005374 TaxID=3364713 RepID=UPI00367BA2A1